MLYCMMYNNKGNTINRNLAILLIETSHVWDLLTCTCTCSNMAGFQD